MTHLNQGNVSAFLTNNASFIAGCPPSDVVAMSTQQVLYILEKKFGPHYHDVFYSDWTVPSPLKVQNTKGGAWMRTSNIVQSRKHASDSGRQRRSLGATVSIWPYAPRGQHCGSEDACANRRSTRYRIAARQRRSAGCRRSA